MFIAILHGTRNNTSLRGVYLINPDGIDMDLPLLEFPLSELLFARVEFAVFNSRSAADKFLSDNPPFVTGRPVANPLPTPRTPLGRSPPPPQSPPTVSPIPSRAPPTRPESTPLASTTSSSSSIDTQPLSLVASVVQLQRDKISRRTSARIQQLYTAERRKQRLAHSSDSGPS